MYDKIHYNKKRKKERKIVERINVTVSPLLLKSYSTKLNPIIRLFPFHFPLSFMPHGFSDVHKLNKPNLVGLSVSVLTEGDGKEDSVGWDLLIGESSVFSNFNVHMNYLGGLFNCRFGLSRIEK